ncbi:MAG: VCBS repeat-containing protein [Sumerlaeia bacterium]
MNSSDPYLVGLAHHPVKSPILKPRKRRSEIALSGAFLIAGALAFSPATSAAVETPFAPRTVAVNVFNEAVPLATGDINGDGDLDILLGDVAPGYQLGWSENANGDATTWNTFAIPPHPAGRVYGATLADVDGDGDLDVIASNYNNYAVFVFENTSGDGSTWATLTSFYAYSPDTVAAGDLDGDGDLDIVFADYLLGTIFWAENVNGDGSSFIVESVSANGQVPGADVVRVGDVDCDGKLDVVAGGRGASLQVFFNELDNPAQWVPQVVANVPVKGEAIELADIDGDGDLDIVAGNQTTDYVQWFANLDGAGTSWSAGINVGFVDDPYSVPVGDLDMDGDLDIIGISERDRNADAGGEVLSFENTAGDGSAWTGRFVTPDGSNDDARVAKLADFDGDGDLDVMSSADYGAFFVRNMTNHRSALFYFDYDYDGYVVTTLEPTTNSLPVSLPSSLACADLDKDGDTDLIVPQKSGDTTSLYWYENVGAGTPLVPNNIDGTTSAVLSVAAGDADRDGDSDIFASHPLDGIRIIPSAVFSVFINDALGTSWTQVPITSANENIHGVEMAPADIDGDGDLDVFLTGITYTDDYPSSPSTFAWAENLDGTGTNWTTHSIAETYPYYYHTAVVSGDFDGDGDMDAAFAGGYFNTFLGSTPDLGTVIALNDYGDGTSWSPSFLPPYNLTGLDAGDIDGDGDLDLAGMAFYEDGFGSYAYPMWFENVNGDASSWQHHFISNDYSYLLVLGHQSAELADIDGDGDLDFVIPGYYEGNASAAFLNERDFGNPWTYLYMSYSDGPGKTADMDGDGDLDFVGAYLYYDEDENAFPYLAIYDNLGGQFSIVSFDITPGVPVDDGDIVPLIGFEVTHEGRAGDRDIELRTVELQLIDNSTSDPLTTSEANDVIQRMYLQLDDGDFVWEPDAAEDEVIVTLGSLSLDANGVFTMVLPESEAVPSILQPHGIAPNRYYISAVTTTNAGSLPQSDFLLIHRTASSSGADQAITDIPLSLEYEADFEVGPVDIFDGPLLVELGDFTATALGIGQGVALAWSTIAETDNAGFHVYRAVPNGDDGYSLGERLTSTLIPSESLFGSGATYQFTDAVILTAGGEERAYFLEDVDLSGRSTLHGPAKTALSQTTSNVPQWTLFE